MNLFTRFERDRPPFPKTPQKDLEKAPPIAAISNEQKDSATSTVQALTVVGPNIPFGFSSRQIGSRARAEMLIGRQVVEAERIRNLLLGRAGLTAS